MKIFFTTIFIILYAVPSFGQVKKKKSIKPKEISACIRKFNLTPQQRMKQYPFNNASQIQLVSFSQNVDTTDYILASIPIINDTLSKSRVKGIINLTNSQIDKLTDIIFNIGLKEDSYTFSVSTAVGLDGGILFIDSNNKIFEYINICFNCQEIEIRTSKFVKSLGQPCIEKFELLKSFFKESGLTF